MKILVGDTWADGYVDEHLGPGQARLAVAVWVPVARLTDVYFQPPRSWQRLWNYLWEVGPTRLFHKVWSRLRERGRNEKFVAIGLGQVLAWNGPSPPGLPVGATALFLAPTHPRCVERVVLEAHFLRPAPPDLAQGLRGAELLHQPAWGEAPEAFAAIGGLLPWAEEKPSEPRLAELFERAEAMLRTLDRKGFRALPRTNGTPRERSERPARLPSGTQSAVLFGYGHYAKTNILPNLPPSIRCVAVHEVDPTQLGPAEGQAFTCDSAPGLRPDERYDVAFLAGYHHTHTPLAAETLRRGAYAVSEKPLVTTRAQLDELVAACREHPGRYFAGFHKRYARFNGMSREDLGVREGDPIRYYCIVFEVPLPARHWYNWASAGSRITSNGCHWIDHFLYVNGYPEIVACGSRAFPDGDVTCWAEAANGANFSMVLTDKGSNRIGLEEYVEMRTPSRKVSVANNSRYRAESHEKVLRRARVNKNEGYTQMYRTIGARIARREAGDSLRSIERSSRLMLDLEEGLSASRPGAGRT